MAAIQTNTLTLNESKKYIINNIKEQIRCLKTGDRCSVVLISGPPGIGKSDLMEQIASELGFGLNAQYLGTMLIEQFGMPLPTLKENSRFQKWSDPDFYSIENLRVQPKSSDMPIILFMDDIHLATKTIQTYFFQLLTYRSIHNKKMPDNFVMVGAGNRAKDRAGAQAILAPIVNRFYFLDIEANANDWVKNFAIPNNVRQDIISFIEIYPDLLMSEPLESQPWASPRSWTYFSQELNQMEIEHDLDISALTTIGKGHIGVEYTTRFIEFVKLYMDWNPSQFLIKGVKLPSIKDNSKIQNYTLMAAIIGEFLKNVRNENWNLQDKSIKSQIKVVQQLFDGILEQCPEIAPLGLRSLILSDKASKENAMLYYELTKSKPELVSAIKLMIGDE
jgi:hypothetical protein